MKSEKLYADIIDLPHYEPRHHPRMSMRNRAAQFAPFAALTGYEDAIKDTEYAHARKSHGFEKVFDT